MNKQGISRLLGLVVIHCGVLWTGVAQAAENIVFNFGPLEFSIAVDSLETYAETGKIEPDFADVAAYLSDEQLVELRDILTSRADIDPVVISQFLYSSQGEVALGQIGNVILTRKRQSGFYAIRSALILAAADEEVGLTPLNVLRKFPVDGIRINSALAFDLINEVSRKIQNTETAIAQIETLAAQQAAASPEVEFSWDLREVGPLAFSKTALVLNDASRQRVFPADLYLPNTQSKQRFPLVVISHGLGSDRQTFRYLAEHLASHGFAVVVPEHPGSNSAQLQALAAGRAQDLTPPQELVDRPLDVQFLLDQLTELHGDRINTEQVGVIGQSFGGYTALALAGAEINLPTLAESCPNAPYSLNWSLVLQCAALQILPPLPQLHDERIVAAIAINPLTSEIFGPEQLRNITVPLILVASGADTVTPALEEQIQSFEVFATTPDKYLALFSKGTHFSALGQTEDDLPLPPAVLGPNPEITQAYTSALSLALFGTTVANQTELQAYLSPRYAQRISQQESPLSLVEATQINASQ